MKKPVVIASALMSAFLLTACGSQSSSTSEHSSSHHSSSKSVAKSSSSKKQSAASSSNSASQTQKYTDEEYAMMGFLKLDGQGVDSLLNNTDNMHWTNSGNKYAIDFGAHTTTMTVEKNSVEVTYDDIDESTHAMGTQNAHKTYTKEELANQFGTNKSKIDQVLGHNSSSSSSTQDQSLTQQASSVLYYGANKLNNQEFKNCYDFAVKNSKLAVSKTTNDQGTTIYKLAPGEVDSYIGYSVDSDGTIHFYKMTPGDSGEIGSASKKDISSYVSSQNATDQVNQLANAATTYGN
jgi:hypothetical protein